MKQKILELFQEEDKWDGITDQELYDKDKMLFRVYNLNGYPEDAIIGRALFDADDYIKAIRYGINLAKQGYDDVYIVNM